MRRQHGAPYLEYHGADPSNYYGVPYRTVGWRTYTNTVMSNQKILIFLCLVDFTRVQCPKAGKTLVFIKFKQRKARYQRRQMFQNVF